MDTTIAPTEGWEERFRVPRTLWARVAAGAPGRGLVASSAGGTYQLHRWSIPDGTLAPLTSEPTGVTYGLPSPDGRWVVWHRDIDGGEIGDWVATPWEGGEARPIAPDVPPAFSFTASFSPGGRWFAAPIVVEAGWRLLVVDWQQGDPGAAHLLDAGPGFVTDVAIDDDGSVAYAVTGGDGDPSTVVRILDPVATATTPALRHEIRHDGAVTTLAFAPDGRGTLLGATTESGWRRPLLVERDGTQRRHLLPDVDGDLQPTGWSPGADAVVLLASVRSATRLHVLDLATGTLRRLGHPDGAVAIGSPHAGAASYLGDDRILTTIEDGTRAPRAVLLDAETGMVVEVLIDAVAGPPSRPWRAIDIRSTDESLVQGWLAVPAGAGPFPAVVDVHGGPADQENDRYFPAAQAWLDRGYAVLTLNYRGSSGFGRAYEEAIWGDVGRRELDDLAAAHDFLVTEAIADPAAVVITGGSYGGYLTLLALTNQPERWAAGVAYVAIADWTRMYEEGEALRAYQESLFGGSPSERPALYARASPMTRVGDLRAPLLVIQGRNDPRCPPGQLEAFAEAARSMGLPVEVDWFDAGHGHGGAAQRIAWQRRAMDFTDDTLGRRSAT